MLWREHQFSKYKFKVRQCFALLLKHVLMFWLAIAMLCSQLAITKWNMTRIMNMEIYTYPAMNRKHWTEHSNDCMCRGSLWKVNGNLPQCRNLWDPHLRFYELNRQSWGHSIHPYNTAALRFLGLKLNCYPLEMSTVSFMGGWIHSHSKATGTKATVDQVLFWNMWKLRNKNSLRSYKSEQLFQPHEQLLSTTKDYYSTYSITWRYRWRIVLTPEVNQLFCSYCYHYW